MVNQLLLYLGAARLIAARHAWTNRPSWTTDLCCESLEKVFWRGGLTKCILAEQLTQK
jgi:hypothetical protein